MREFRMSGSVGGPVRATSLAYPTAEAAGALAATFGTLAELSCGGQAVGAQIEPAVLALQVDRVAVKQGRGGLAAGHGRSALRCGDWDNDPGPLKVRGDLFECSSASRGTRPNYGRAVRSEPGWSRRRQRLSKTEGR
jgi:hypothetical protein